MGHSFIELWVGEAGGGLVTKLIGLSFSAGCKAALIL
jgi:hypothetical protein